MRCSLAPASAPSTRSSFGGFSPDSLASRINDANSKVIITADEGLRGGRKVPLKANTDDALKRCAGNEKVIVVRRTGGQVMMAPGRDVWYHDEAATVPAECKPEKMKAEDPLFILYTSGSTGKPRACCTPPAAISSMPR